MVIFRYHINVIFTRFEPSPPWNSMPFPWRRLRVGAAAAVLLATLQLGAPGFARVRRRKEPLQKELGVYGVLCGITYGI